MEYFNEIDIDYIDIHNPEMEKFNEEDLQYIKKMKGVQKNTKKNTEKKTKNILEIIGKFIGNGKEEKKKLKICLKKEIKIGMIGTRIKYNGYEKVVVLDNGIYKIVNLPTKNCF